MEFFSPQGYETRSAKLEFYGIHMDQSRSAEEKFPKKLNPSALPLADSANFSALSDIQEPSQNYSQNTVFELEGHNFPIAFSGVTPLSTVGETKRTGLP